MKALRRIDLTGTENTRDLGGYPLKNGKATAFGKFLRSAFPSGLTPADEAFLSDMQITTVIDLRSAFELQRAPCHFADRPGFTYHNFHLSGGDIMRDGEEQVSPSYMAITRCNNMPKVLRVLANAPGGCLFHCAAGKDRTGTLAAILLLLAGAQDADIIADYTITEIYLQQLIAELKNLPDFPEYMTQAKPKYMADFLHLFQEAYGTAEDYMHKIGLTAAEIKKLREKLIA